MPWDPSQRPRQPRVNAYKRGRVRKAGELRYVAMVPSNLTDSGIDAIIAAAGHVNVPTVCQAMLPIFAGYYLSAKNDPPAPRGETRYQLRMLVHLSWMIDHHPEQARSLRREFFDVLDDCNRQVFETMRETLRVEFDHPSGRDMAGFSYFRVDIRLFAYVAQMLDASLGKGGDYKNQALANTVQALFFLFDTVTNRFPTFSRHRQGPIGRNGEQRSIVSSDCGRFVLAFFARVDPALSAGQITNAFEACCTRNRTEERAGHRYYDGMADLLHS